MTLLWCDGFEGFEDGVGESHLVPTYLYTGSTTEGEVGICSDSTCNWLTPRSGKWAWTNNGTTWQEASPETHWLYISSPTSDSTWIAGFGMRVGYQNYEKTELLQFRDLSENEYLTIAISEDSSVIQVFRGSRAGTLLGYATANLPTAVWFFFECKVKFDDTDSSPTGTVEIRINEETVLSLTGEQTVPTGVGTSPERFLFCGSNSGMHRDVDDLYICDSAGSVNNDFLGDMSTKRLKANADGTTNDFTPVGDANNYQTVDDDDPDGNTTYNWSATSTDRDMYNTEDIADITTLTPASIAAVSVVSYCQDTDGGLSPEHVVVSGASEATDAIAPTATYGHQYSFFETDPQGGGAWTEARVDGMEIGVQLA
jgi:hypothetical protein